MSATNTRIRFYLFCDSSSLTVDYAPELADYPEYPKQQFLTIYSDRYKSTIGSNFWNYYRGTSFAWKMNWVEVSDNCTATIGLIVGSAVGYNPHIVIWDSVGIDGITFASLSANVTPLGTFFCENDQWAPEEVRFGLWNFDTTFRREA